MDAVPVLFIFTFIVGLLAGLGLAESLWGVDSRPGIGDDHAR